MNLRYNLRFMSFYFYPFFIIVSNISFCVVRDGDVMFVKVVKNNRGRPNTSFIAIVESYREDG